jgi:hypothetical protein
MRYMGICLDRLMAHLTMSKGVLYVFHAVIQDVSVFCVTMSYDTHFIVSAFSFVYGAITLACIFFLIFDNQ